MHFHFNILVTIPLVTLFTITRVLNRPPNDMISVAFQNRVHEVWLKYCWSHLLWLTSEPCTSNLLLCWINPKLCSALENEFWLKDYTILSFRNAKIWWTSTNSITNKTNSITSDYVWLCTKEQITVNELLISTAKLSC